MSAKMESKRVAACLVVLAIVAAAGMGLPKAHGLEGPGLIPQKAYNPDPADGATGVAPEDIVLAWSAGQGAVLHRIYFGTDLEAVADGSLMVYQGTQPGTILPVGDLGLGQTYYWRIDEFTPYGAITPGDVWSFTTRRFSPVG